MSYSAGNGDLTVTKRKALVEDLVCRHDAFIRRDVSKSASFRPKAQHRAAVFKMLGIIDNQVVCCFLGTQTPAVGFRHRLADVSLQKVLVTSHTLLFYCFPHDCDQLGKCGMHVKINLDPICDQGCFLST